VVKGKFSYLSPEAAMGEPVDARTDIFALGIVLWEMLAGRRLFLGETDFQTVKLVQQANIPSLQRLNPDVDADLEKVLGKALARDKNERFQTAREMGDALSGYLYSKQLKVNSFDIATLVKGVIEARAASKASQPREASIIDRLIQEELLRFTSLDDMNDPLAPGASASPDDANDGAKPLDAGLFENPADWFSNDEDVASAVKAGTGPSSEPGWRESGVEQPEDLASLEDTGPIGTPKKKAPAEEPKKVVQTAPEPAAKTAEAPKAPEPAKSGGGAGLYVAIAIVVVLGAAAGAWFGGLIPH
jgi:serine/threonine-protein kinase